MECLYLILHNRLNYWIIKILIEDISCLRKGEISMKGKQRKFVAFFTSIILFVSLLCESAVAVKAESNDWVKLDPYQTDNAVVCTVENGKKMVMMGEEFTEGIYVSDSRYSMSAQYNLGKKYDMLRFTVGHIDDENGSDGTMTISVDGKEVKSIPLSYSMINQTETIDVKGVSQLSIEMKCSSFAVYGVANVCAGTSSGSVVPISRVDLDTSSVSMKVGEEKLLNASIFPENATDKTLIWKSADTEVATVSQNGLVKAVSEGTTMITVAGGNNVTASCAVTVSEKEHTHSFSAAWKSDSENHWKECECGEKSEIAPHSFIWITDQPATDSSVEVKHEECEICSYKRISDVTGRERDNRYDVKIGKSYEESAWADIYMNDSGTNDIALRMDGADADTYATVTVTKYSLTEPTVNTRNINTENDNSSIFWLKNINLDSLSLTDIYDSSGRLICSITPIHKATYSEGFIYFDDNAEGTFQCSLDPSSETLLLTSYEGDAETLEIPGRVMIDGKVYGVTVNVFSFRQESLRHLKFVKTNNQRVNVSTNSLSEWFYNAKELESIDMSGLDTARVTDMSKMFYWCENLRNVEFSEFDTARVTDMSEMFYCCKNLSVIDVSDWNTANVRNMYGMFGHCENLDSINLSGLNTTRVTNMSQMFSACVSLSSINLSALDIARVTDMSEMFSGCNSLGSIDVSGWNTEKVTNISRMFFICSSLSSIDLSGFDLSKVTKASEIFSDCFSLQKIITPKAMSETAIHLDYGFVDDENNIYWSLNNSTPAATVLSRQIEEHIHNFSTWRFNSESHWRECECGKTSEVVSHSFTWVIDETATETSTGLKHEECEVCSYKRNEGTVIDKISGEHTHSYRAWGRNEEAHWKECECGASIEVAPHSFTWVIDEPATETAAGLKHEECEICSFKRNVGTVIDKISSEHTHSFSAAWKSDAQSHWIECGCGEKFAVASHAFSWITDKPATASTTGLKHEECAVCGYKRNQNTVIGKLGNIPAKGQELTDRKGGAVYRVISVETKGGTVEYTKSLNNKTAIISIPSTVEIDGISYKVTGIAANAFKNNKKIVKVIIGNNVTSIEKNSFSGCSKLKTMTIGNNVVSIGDNAFFNCTSLKKVTIPVKVKKIGKQAFYGCKKLKTIRINTKKLSGKFVGSKAFAKIDPKATVKVPSSCLKSYKKLFQKKGFNGKRQKIKK